MTSIDVIVPVMERPHRAVPFMESITTSYDHEEYDVLITAVANTDDVETGSEWYKAGANLLYYPGFPGSFAQKVNYAFERTEREWLFLVGDDVAFRPRWIDEAMLFAPIASVIGTNDLGNGAVTSGQHATHMFIEREYVVEIGASWDGPSVVCHEGYRHCYVDDEIVKNAKQHGTWHAALDSVVEHLHPAWGKAEHDDTYAIGGASMAADGAIHRVRVERYG